VPAAAACTGVPSETEMLIPSLRAPSAAAPKADITRPFTGHWRGSPHCGASPGDIIQDHQDCSGLGFCPRADFGSGIGPRSTVVGRMTVPTGSAEATASRGGGSGARLTVAGALEAPALDGASRTRP